MLQLWVGPGKASTSRLKQQYDPCQTPVQKRNDYNKEDNKQMVKQDTPTTALFTATCRAPGFLVLILKNELLVLVFSHIPSYPVCIEV